MKYIKAYEGRHLVKGQTLVDTKFKEDDYISLTTDFVNGYPVNEISKRVFKIVAIIGKDKFNKRNQYKLYYLNDKFFNWEWEDALKFAKKSNMKITWKNITYKNEIYQNIRSKISKSQ